MAETKKYSMEAYDVIKVDWRHIGTSGGESGQRGRVRVLASRKGRIRTLA